MIRRLLLSLILVFLVTAGVAVAAPTPEAGTLPFYWISGVARDANMQPLPNRVVAFYYGDFSSNIITTWTSQDGTYQINAFDLYYFYGLPITFETTSYNIAVCQQAGYSTGTVEAINLTTRQGYTEEALTAIIGGGPTIGPQVPAGTVPLNIARVGSDIRVSWEANPAYANPHVFILTGDGSGVFTNAAASWISIEAYAAAHSSEFNADLSSTIANAAGGFFLHKGQVGDISTSTPEAYYKAVQAGINTSTTTGAATLESAWAAGKINYTFGAGNTFFAIPLVTAGTIADIMGSQNFPSGTGYTAGSRIYKQTSDRVAFDTADYATNWTDTITLTPDKGYYFSNTGSLIAITLVGNVPNYSVAESFGGGNNLFGVQYPSKYGFSIFGAGTFSGDRVLIYNRNAAPVPGFDPVTQAEFGVTTVRLSGMLGYYYQQDPAATSPLQWSPPSP